MKETQNSMSINCSFVFYMMQHCIYAEDNSTIKTVLVLFCFHIFNRKRGIKVCL